LDNRAIEFDFLLTATLFGPSVVTFCWIDIAIVDATNGVRISLLPTILPFTVGLN
jgi:hypothetical protein